MKERRLSLALVLIVALLAGYCGMTLRAERFIEPVSQSSVLSDIRPDGWIATGSRIVIPDLASRGNRLDLQFDSWRPEGMAPAELQISVCDQVVSHLTVQPQSASHTVYLRGSCEPREVQFAVANPFSTAADGRQLGAKLISARLYSGLGIPLFSARAAFVGMAPFVLLALLSYCALTALLALSERTAVVCVAAVSAAGAFMLGRSDPTSLMQLVTLWGALCALLGGLLFAGKVTERIDARRMLAEPPRIGISGILVVLTIFLGAALRFYGLDFGLPSNFHPDEVPKVNAIMRMVANGNLNPQYFLHPSLLLYLTYFTNTLFHLFGMAGEFKDTAFLAGRTVSAIAGSISILLIFFIGRRLYGSMTGYVAAFLLAVFPLHVTCSRYLKEDALLVFWILAALLALLIAVQEGRKSFLLLTAVLCGFAASTKYSGMLCAVFLGIAPWLRSRSFRPDREFLKWGVISGLLFPLAFVATTPYSILDWSRFVHDFGLEQHHMERGHTVAVDAWSQYWMFHLSRSIVPGMTWLPAVVALFGVGALMRRGRREDYLLLLLVALFYLPAEWVKAKPAPQPERYILPCLPFLGIVIAEFFRMMWNSWARSAVPLLLGVAFVLPLYRTATLASELRDDTRIQVAQWMRENLPAGTKVYIDIKRYSPEFQDRYFDISYMDRTKIVPELAISRIRDSGGEYLVMSSLLYDRYFSQPMQDASVRQRVRDIFRRLPMVKEFTPRYGTYGFHNPTITVFSLKQQDIDRLSEEIRQKRQGLIAKTSNEAMASMRWADVK